MTDLEEFLAFITRLNLPFDASDHRKWIQTAGSGHYGEKNGTEICIPSRDVAIANLDLHKVTGYGGFFQTWCFDLEGKFVETGAWE